MVTSQPQEPSVLALLQRGDGPPVLIIHGIYGSGFLLSSLTNHLATRYHVIAPDMRGHGDSGSIPGPMYAESVALDLLPTLDKLGVTSVHVIGHSHGGATAQAFAHLAPEQVRSLTLVSTYTFQPLMWWERLAGVFTPLLVMTLRTTALSNLIRILRPSGGGPRLSRDNADLLARQIARNNARRMSVAFAAARSFNSRFWLDDINVPTLVVTGTSDHMVSPRQARLLAQGIRNAKYEELPGAGHMLPLTHQDEFEQLVMEWLAKVEQAAPALQVSAQNPRKDNSVPHERS